MKRVVTIVFFMCLFSPYLFAGGESEPATQRQTFQEYNVEGTVITSYPARQANTQGIMHVVEPDNDKENKKLLYEGPSFKQKYPTYTIKEGSRVIFVWTKVAEEDGYASAATRLIVLDGQVLTR